MDYFPFISLITTVLSLLLGSIVLFMNPSKRLNILFFIMIIGIGVWSFCEYQYNTVEDQTLNQFWNQVETIWPVVVATLLLFSLVFTERKIARNRIFLFGLFGVSILASLILLYTISVDYSDTASSSILLRYAPDIREALYQPILIVFMSLAMAPVISFIHYFIKVRDTAKRNRALFVLLGFVFLLLVGVYQTIPSALGSLPGVSYLPRIDYFSPTIGAPIMSIFMAIGIVKFGAFAPTPEKAANNIISTMSEGLIILDREGRVTKANGAARELFERQDRGFKKRSIIHYLPKRERRRFLKEFNWVLREKGKISDFEFNIRTSSKRSKPVMAGASVIRGRGGEVHGTVLVLHDLTERNKSRRAIIRAKEEAENANRAKSEFLANMSHEIRTPMNGVLGMTELALEASDEGERRRYLEMVSSSGETLLTVINDILDFSKIEAGKLTIEQMEFNLFNLIGETLSSQAVEAHRKDLEVLFDIGPDVPMMVKGDPVRIKQVLANLVRNAVKFTNEGYVLLKVRTEPGGGNSNLRLRFTVEDTGIGIPRSRQKEIFEMFTQADGSTTRKYGGTGLGLSICRNLVSLMGGRIWMQSEGIEGRGSKFHVTLDLAECTEPVYENFDRPTELEGMRVLVVDDSDINRRIVKKILESWGLSVDTANSAKEGMIRLSSAQEGGEPYQMMMLDNHMPGKDGLEMAQDMQDDKTLKSPIVMMLTSSDQGMTVQRCKDLGISHYLVKPFGPSQLMDVIVNLLVRSGKVDPEKYSKSIHEKRRSLAVGWTSRVLLVEDNRTNALLARSFLEKLGQGVTWAQDGNEAVDIFKKESFDIVLMDVHMPKMDGIEATKAIREIEKRTGSYTPIIALTAHVMQGDRERFLSMGMDGYLPKPLKKEELARVLMDYTGSGESTELQWVDDDEADVADNAGDEYWDPDEFLENIDSNRGLFNTLIQIYLEDSAKDLKRLKDAVDCRDAHEVEEAAHKIKGSSANIYAKKMSEICFELEKFGREGNIAKAASRLPTLDSIYMNTIKRLEGELA